MGRGSGAGTGKGEGHGEGLGEDAVEGAAAGGIALCCFLIFMWVIGLPMLLTGIIMVSVWSYGALYTTGIVLVVISVLCIVIGIVLIVFVTVAGAKSKTAPSGANTTQVTYNHPTVIHTVQPGGQPAYGYSNPQPGPYPVQHGSNPTHPQAGPSQPPPYSQHPFEPSPYPQPGGSGTEPPVPGAAQPSKAGTELPAEPSKEQLYS